jgi:hypothetical protein
MLSPSVPLPVPVLAVTVQVVPLPLTPVIVGAPLSPELTSVKLPVLTPDTLVLKVTIQEMLANVVGVGLARSIEDTVGGGATTMTLSVMV